MNTPGYLGPDDRRMMESFRNPIDVREAVRREIEKEKIREEIIAKEIARKRLLEAEVRREMMVEREMALRRGERFPLLSTSAPASGQFEPGLPQLHYLSTSRSIEERLALSLQERLPYEGRRGIGGFEMAPFQRAEPKISQGKSSSEEKMDLALELQGYHPRGVVGGLGALPFQRSSSELKMISEVVGKEKIVFLAKPEGNPSGTKRKAVTLPVQGDSELPLAASKKKVKQEWNCPICQVTATSEQSLKEHFGGRKHRSRIGQTSQETAKNYAIGFSPKNSGKPPGNQNPKHEEGELEQVKNTGEAILFKKSNSDVKNKNSQEAGRQKFSFWCELCQVGTYSKKVLSLHKRGKKHVRRLQQLNQSGSSAHVGNAPRKGNKGETDIEEVVAKEIKEDEIVVVVEKEMKDEEGGEIGPGGEIKGEKDGEVVPAEEIKDKKGREVIVIEKDGEVASE
ncbi:uncharacterized protein LOC127795207 isoform X2 [Diospyros lotus]|uniref:uncharacterized protein LOC127795207 isoform X2 n=1 Tax=Diospyros lotus TaxID=55363 RepID=UPI002256CD28|nr:uncharacterized protein LOC127795207 isoform X2 [Diospyros lotus]